MKDFQCVGVDVAKDKFDVAFFQNKKYINKCFDNNNRGYQSFLKWLSNYTQIPWVCMEATGHYSELIADFLVKHSIRVSIVNPLQIKSYARVKLSRNKTDQVDAQIIAEYCEKMRPREFACRSQSQKELKDLTKLLDTLKNQAIQLRNQLHSTQGTLARKAINKLIKELEKEIARIEKQLNDLVTQNQTMNDNMVLMTSIKGIGKMTAYKILAQAPDIHHFSNAKQFAAYIGISPRQHQSGKWVGRTSISKMGDSRIRKVLYMAALVAKRYNKALVPFINRLKDKGKAPKAIVCAIMRKLAHLIYGVLKSRHPFNPALVAKGDCF